MEIYTKECIDTKQVWSTDIIMSHKDYKNVKWPSIFTRLMYHFISRMCGQRNESSNDQIECDDARWQ